MPIPIIVGFISYIIPQENCTTLVLTNHEYASKHLSHVATNLDILTASMASLILDSFSYFLPPSKGNMYL